MCTGRGAGGEPGDGRAVAVGEGFMRQGKHAGAACPQQVGKQAEQEGARPVGGLPAGGEGNSSSSLLMSSSLQSRTVRGCCCCPCACNCCCDRSEPAGRCTWQALWLGLTPGDAAPSDATLLPPLLVGCGSGKAQLAAGLCSASSAAAVDEAAATDAGVAAAGAAAWLSEGTGAACSRVRLGAGCPPADDRLICSNPRLGCCCCCCRCCCFGS